MILTKTFWLYGNGDNLNAELERAGRVRDFLDFGELLCRDALERNESCGVISARNIKLKTVKHFVMMKILLMLPSGSLKVMEKLYSPSGKATL